MKQLIQRYLVQLISIFLIVLGVALPQLNQPAHWDETAYIDGVRTIFHAHGFPFVEFWSYKPPLHFEIGALMWGIFGIGRWQLRLAVVVELAMLVLLFKNILSQLLESFGDKTVKPASWQWRLGSWLLVALLMSNPVVAGQAFLYQPELLLVVLWLLTVHCYAHGKLGWYWLAASLLVMVKESAVLNLGVIVLFELVKLLSSQGEWRHKIRRFGIIASPFWWLLVWLLGNKLVLGWWLWPYNTEFFSTQKPYDAPALMKLEGMFLDGTLWLTTVLAVLAGLWQVLGSKQHKSNAQLQLARTYLVLFLGAGLAQVLFALIGVFTPRYVMSIYPALIAVIAMGYGYMSQKSQVWRIVAIVGIAAVVIFQGKFLIDSTRFGRFDGWALDHDWRYMRTTQKYQALLSWWQQHYPGYTLIGDWLAWSYYIDPLYGYVESPLSVEKFQNCEQIKSLKQHFLLITGIGFDAQETRLVTDCASQLQLQSLAEFTPIVVYTAKDEQ